MFKIGDTVRILSTYETRLWGIAGKEGVVDAIDGILGTLWVRVPGYAAFVLPPDEVEHVQVERQDSK